MTNDTLLTKIKNSDLSVWVMETREGKKLFSIFDEKTGFFIVEDSEIKFFVKTGSGMIYIKPEGCMEAQERMVREIVENATLAKPSWESDENPMGFFIVESGNLRVEFDNPQYWIFWKGQRQQN